MKHTTLSPLASDVSLLLLQAFRSDILVPDAYAMEDAVSDLIRFEERWIKPYALAVLARDLIDEGVYFISRRHGCVRIAHLRRTIQSVIKLAFLGSEYSRSNPSPATLLMSFNEDKLVRN